MYSQRYSGTDPHGKALTPDITVKDGSRTLVKGTDYDVVYSDNIEVSTADKPAKAVVTGKGTTPDLYRRHL